MSATEQTVELFTDTSGIEDLGARIENAVMVLDHERSLALRALIVESADSVGDLVAYEQEVRARGMTLVMKPSPRLLAFLVEAERVA